MSDGIDAIAFAASLLFRRQERQGMKSDDSLAFLLSSRFPKRLLLEEKVARRLNCLTCYFKKRRTVIAIQTKGSSAILRGFPVFLGVLASWRLGVKSLAR
ncbi:MAG: hypothetical protein V3V20_02580, partial [Algisphaera sp.]